MIFHLNWNLARILSLKFLSCQLIQCSIIYFWHQSFWLDIHVVQYTFMTLVVGRYEGFMTVVVGRYEGFMTLVVGRYEGLFTRRSRISRGRSPREIWLLRVKKASYIPTRAINCLLYQNYTHNKTFFKTNLTFYSIRVVVFVDGYIAVIRKMRIETKHSMTWGIFFCVRLYGVVCFFQVRISFSDDFAMGARGSGRHDIYFPWVCVLGIHEVLSSWHVTFFN